METLNGIIGLLMGAGGVILYMLYVVAKVMLWAVTERISHGNGESCEKG